MPWQVEGACYATQLDAVRAAVSAEVGKVVTLGTQAYVVDVTATTATSATYLLRCVSCTTNIAKVIPVASQPCGLLDWPDAVSLSWALVAVWLAVYALRYLSKVVRS